MKKNIITSMALGLAAALVITSATPVAAFAAAPSDNDTGWVDVVDDGDDFYAEDENGEFHNRDYYEDDEFYAEDENGEFHSREYFDDDEDDDFDDEYEDFDDEDDYDDDEDFIEISTEEEAGRDIVNNRHAGYSYANCRENPDLESEILFTIPNGTRVYPTGKVVNNDGFDWYEIHLAGAYDYGWIAGHLIGR